MLGIIFFSLVFGAALTMLPEEKTQPMVRVLDALGEAIVKIIDFAMRLAPYGVFGLIFVVTSRFGFALLLKLGLYVAVVLVGLLLHGAISTCWDNVRGTPKTCARKSTVTPSNSAVPFMHIVDPSGSTKPAILGGIFNSLSATAMLVGSVALLELVENAVMMLARIRL